MTKKKIYNLYLIKCKKEECLFSPGGTYCQQLSGHAKQKAIKYYAEGLKV